MEQEFHIYVRAWRERIGISQETVADALGVTRSRVTQIESGKEQALPVTRIAVENILERLEEERAAVLNANIERRRVDNVERRKALLG